MLDQCQANLEQWRQIDEEIKRQKEMGNEVDALAFLDKVLETSEKIVREQAETVDIEDKKLIGSLLEEAKGKQSIAEAKSMKGAQ
jgi:hypothetical protein